MLLKDGLRVVLRDVVDSIVQSTCFHSLMAFVLLFCSFLSFGCVKHVKMMGMGILFLF